MRDKNPTERKCKKCRVVKPIGKFPPYVKTNGHSPVAIHGRRHTCSECLTPASQILATLPPDPIPASDRPAVLYGYVRVSTDQQASEGKSLEEQTERIEKFFQFTGPEKKLAWGGVFQDAGVSGFKKPFRERPAGGVLFKRLLPGDHLVMTSLDRGFRNFKDAINTFEDWLDRGIYLHLLNYQISTDNHVGRMILRMLSVTAQFQRDMTAEATRLAHRRLRRQGRMPHLDVDVGWKMVGPKHARVVVPDHDVRKVILRIAHLVENEGWSYNSVWRQFVQDKVPMSFRMPYAGGRTGEWNPNLIRRWHQEYKKNPTFKRIRYLTAMGLDPDTFDHDHEPIEVPNEMA